MSNKFYLLFLLLGIIFVSSCVKTDIDLTNCKTYYNGCNTCPVENGEIKNNYCTQRYCPPDTIEEPRCIDYINENIKTACYNDDDCKSIDCSTKNEPGQLEPFLPYCVNGECSCRIYGG